MKNKIIIVIGIIALACAYALITVPVEAKGVYSKPLAANYCSAPVETSGLIINNKKVNPSQEEKIKELEKEIKRLEKIIKNLKKDK